MEPIINSQVPEFKVQAFQNGNFKTVSNEDIKGKWAIFFFYPADFTFVCPTELVDLYHAAAPQLRRPGLYHLGGLLSRGATHRGGPGLHPRHPESAGTGRLPGGYHHPGHERRQNGHHRLCAERCALPRQ